MGEKATILREEENKLTFIVDKNSSKEQIKKAIETLYGLKVVKVNTIIATKGKKKAHIKLSEKHSAEEIASHFGVL